MDIESSTTVRTVSQLTAEIKSILETTYRFVTVSGEISNLKTPFSGHHYFTLKDEKAQLRSVLFKGQQRYLMEPLRNGQQVLCRGRISVYEPRGDYQLIVDTVDQHGLGVLQMKFAALKQKLAEAGLFDSARKRPLPFFPGKIVVISSATGAAIRDFLKICAQRRTPAHIQVLPVPVQGDRAPAAIVRALTMANTLADCDIIVLCRGGGSIEDLWAFNEEEVARAIVRSRIPVVTGIGHETDTTIADLCADLRCPTPTGVAERIVPDALRLKQEIRLLTTRMQRTISQRLTLHDKALAGQWQGLHRFRNRIASLSLRLDPLTERFYRAMAQNISTNRDRLARLTMRLEHQAPRARISFKSQKLQHLEQAMTQRMVEILRHNEERLAKTVALLHGVSPLSTLSRGYSIVSTTDPATGEEVTVTDSAQVEGGDRLQVRLHRGRLTCEVTGKEKTE